MAPAMLSTLMRRRSFRVISESATNTMMRSSRSLSSAGVVACKFGGTSMATPDSWKTVKGIMDSDSNRKLLVVSAPGKRFKEDVKTTDVLIKLTNTPVGDARKSLVEEIHGRYMQILDSFASKTEGFNLKFEALRPELLASENKDFIVSRGEFLSAATVADAFDYDFLEPSELVFLKNGAIDYDKTLSALSAKVKNSSSGRKFVMPGFYGFDTALNQIGVLPRGGSDISGALLAQAGGASVYENWTDVDGVYTADPTKIDGALKIDTLSFEELRALGHNGAQVLHPATLGNPDTSAASVLDFPVHLRNTFSKTLKEGTLICPKTVSASRILGVVMGDDSIKIVGTPGAGSNTERGYVKELAQKVLASSASVDASQDAKYSPWISVSVDAAGVKQAATTLHSALAEKNWFIQF